MTDLPVSQRAREAAAAIIALYHDPLWSPYSVLTGLADGAGAVQAFARFERDMVTAAPQKCDHGGENFQRRVQPWLMACFGKKIARNRKERNHRFLEEALELVQACGCTASEAHQLVEYVFGRPIGEPNQEVGGVMVTLAALCLANGLDMHEAGEIELARIWTKVEAIRDKQAAKPKHSPLPISIPPASPDNSALAALLCVIHRDGGQRIDAIGLAAATDEAMRISSERIAEVERLREVVERTKRKYTDDEITHGLSIYRQCISEGNCEDVSFEAALENMHGANNTPDDMIQRVEDRATAAEAEVARLREAGEGLLPFTAHAIGCAIYQRSWATSEPDCTCGMDEARAALNAQGGE